MGGIFEANKFFGGFVHAAFGMKSDGADAFWENKKFFATGHAPADAGLINVGVDAGRAREERHRDIHLLDRKLVRLNVSCKSRRETPATKISEARERAVRS